MLKLYIGIAAVSGWILLNCVTVGGYQLWSAYKEWTAPLGLVINYQDLQLDDLKQIQKAVVAELKFRSGN